MYKFRVLNCILMMWLLHPCIALGLSDNDYIKQNIDIHSNFPRNGINFYDIGSLLRKPKLYNLVIDKLVSRYQGKKIDAILALESRGFLFACPLGLKLNIPVIMLRKPGKLPGRVVETTYNKEYGADALQMQSDIIPKGAAVIIIDDLLATGGTMQAAVNLANMAKVSIFEIATVIEIQHLQARYNIQHPVYSIVKF